MQTERAVIEGDGAKSVWARFRDLAGYAVFKDNASNASSVYVASLSAATQSLPAVSMGTVHPKTGGQVTCEETNIAIIFPPGAVSSKADVSWYRR